MWIHQVGIMDRGKPALLMRVRDCVKMETSPNHFNHGMITMIPPKIAVVAEKSQVKDLIQVSQRRVEYIHFIYYVPNPKIFNHDPLIVVFKAFHYTR